MTAEQSILAALGVATPIFQAPMAGVSTPEMAAAVTNAGGLGALGLGAVGVAGARAQIRQTRALTGGAFAVNLFCHAPAVRDAARERAWLARLAPEFHRFAAEPPGDLSEIYQSFQTDRAMFEMLLEECPPVVSFHFGLPERQKVEALQARGIVLLASATDPAEARAVAALGFDAVIAQGWEAGGHRGCFDPAAQDQQLGVLPLVRLIRRAVDLPCIAAGGIMDGAGIAAALALGATAAQLGTAFVACPESAADDAYRTALAEAGARGTEMTRAISGRPARGLGNAFVAWGRSVPAEAVPAYPVCYDAGKALNAAAKALGAGGYGAQWAGQGAALARAMPAADLVVTLSHELAAA